MNLVTFARLGVLSAFVLTVMLVKNVAAQTSRKAEMQHFENITPIDPGGSGGSSGSSEGDGGGGISGGSGGGAENEPGVEPNIGTPGNLHLKPMPTPGYEPKQINSSQPKPEMQHFELRLVPSPVPPTHYLRSYGQVAWPIVKSTAIRTAWSNKWTIAAWAAAKFGYYGAFATRAVAEAAALTATTALGATIAFVTSTGSVILIPRRIGCEWGPSCEPGPGPAPVGPKIGPPKETNPPRH